MVTTEVNGNGDRNGISYNVTYKELLPKRNFDFTKLESYEGKSSRPRGTW